MVTREQVLAEIREFLVEKHPDWDISEPETVDGVGRANDELQVSIDFRRYYMFVSVAVE